MKMKKVLLFLFFLALMAYQASSVGTTAATTITATGTNCTLDYTDLDANAKPQITAASDIAITVDPIYALAALNEPADADVSVDTPRYYTYTVENKSNASETYALSKGATDYGASGGSGWTVTIVESDSDDVITELLVPEAGTEDFRIKVVPANLALYGHQASVTVTVAPQNTPAGTYAGANGVTYGDLDTDSDTTITSFAGPLLTLTRTATVDAPTAYIALDDDLDHDAVPGAVITYTYTYSNTGDTSSESNIFIDKIPTNTVIAQVNTTEVLNVSITAAQSTAVGWSVSTTTEASLSSARTAYGAADWTLIGTIEGNGDWANGGFASGNFFASPALETAWIKFEKLHVGTAEDNKTLTWGVVIN